MMRRSVRAGQAGREASGRSENHLDILYHDVVISPPLDEKAAWVAEGFIFNGFGRRCLGINP
jgi:hypothetical protein